MEFTIEFEREADGRWIAEIPSLPGTMAYGATPEQARAHAQALALRVVAERLEQEEAGSETLTITFRAARASGRAHGRGRCLRRCSGSAGT